MIDAYSNLSWRKVCQIIYVLANNDPLLFGNDPSPHAKLSLNGMDQEEGHPV